MEPPSPSRVVQVEFAAAAAESVLHVVEAAAPGDPRARDAVRAARAWARGEATDEQARDAETAARALARELTSPGVANAAWSAARAAAAAAGTARNPSECTRALHHAAQARTLPGLDEARSQAARGPHPPRSAGS